MSRIGPWPPCSGIQAGPQAGQVTRGSSAAVAIWRLRDAVVTASALRAVCSRRGEEAEQDRCLEHELVPGVLGVAGELSGELGQVLCAGVVFQQEADVRVAFGPDAQPVGVRAVLGVPGAQVHPLDDLLFAEPGLEFPAAVLSGVAGEGGEEPGRPGHVPQPLGALQGELPAGADLWQPLLVLAVFLAQQRRADRAEDVVPGRGPGLEARPERAQHPQPHQHAQPVPGRREVAERERGKLVGGQHAVPSYKTGQLAVAVGQVSGHRQHRSLVPGCRAAYPCPCACPAGMIVR
jgi:hypothetical protein